MLPPPTPHDPSPSDLCPPCWICVGGGGGGGRFYARPARLHHVPDEISRVAVSGWPRPGPRLPYATPGAKGAPGQRPLPVFASCCIQDSRSVCSIWQKALSVVRRLSTAAPCFLLRSLPGLLRPRPFVARARVPADPLGRARRPEACVPLTRQPADRPCQPSLEPLLLPARVTIGSAKVLPIRLVWSGRSTRGAPDPSACARAIATPCAR